MGDNSRLGLYIAIPIYFSFVFFMALIGYRNIKKRHKDQEDRGFTEDAMISHYLAGRTFEAFVTAGTLFASLFSGYTVVGVPNEAFKTGWRALRWVPSCTGSIVFGYMGTGPRLHKASKVRNHQAPTDFITDRFRSQFLRYTIFILQIFPALLYLAAQLSAISSTFNGIFGIDPKNQTSVIVISLFILICEWMGGLSAVAMTDGAQGCIMILSFLMLVGVIKTNFGGWSSLDYITYPQPKFYQTPTLNQQWLFWNFTIINVAFFTLPHLLQRTYAAKSLKALKAGYSVMTIGTWLTIFSGVFIGTVLVQILGDQESPPASPYSAFIETILAIGGFPEAVGVISYLAALAAIMSTADSLLIAISQLFVSEVLYPLIPKSSPKRITILGRVSSLTALIIAFLLYRYAADGLPDLLAIQFGLSLQAVPTFLIGLFAYGKGECHPWVLAISCWGGCIFTFLIHYFYNKSANENTFILDPGVTAFFANIGSCFVLEGALRLSFFSWETPKKAVEIIPKWDLPSLARFGEVPLTSTLLTSMMKGVYEPLLDFWFVAMFYTCTVAMLPWSSSEQPSLDIDGFLAYAPNIIRGIPSWAFQVIIFTMVLSLMNLFAISKLPNEFPKRTTEEQENPNLIELTDKELLRRVSYDEPNLDVIRRRSTMKASLSKNLIPDIIQEHLVHVSEVDENFETDSDNKSSIRGSEAACHV